MRKYRISGIAAGHYKATTMRGWLTIIATCVVMLLPAVASAAKGVVAYCKSGCDYFIVETDMGYALLEWYGGDDPSEDDELVGDYEAYGMKDIYNLSTDSEMRVWIEDYWLSRDEAFEKLYDECD
jgi:hypothetical protein